MARVGEESVCAPPAPRPLFSPSFCLCLPLPRGCVPALARAAPCLIFPSCAPMFGFGGACAGSADEPIPLVSVDDRELAKVGVCASARARACLILSFCVCLWLCERLGRGLCARR